MNKQGKLIILEGADGVGKTTVSKKLEESLCAQGCKAVIMPVPRHSGIGEFIRKRLLTEDISLQSRMSLQMVFLAEHMEVLEYVKSKMLQDHDYVIMDRSLLSGLVYGYIDLCETNNKDPYKLLFPTYEEIVFQMLEHIDFEMFYLTCDVDEAIRRLKERKGNNTTHDLYDDVDNIIHSSRKVYESYLEIFKYKGKRCKIEHDTNHEFCEIDTTNVDVSIVCQSIIGELL